MIATECLASCPHHQMPCENAIPHEMHKHRAMFGTLQMFCWWVETVFDPDSMYDIPEGSD